MGVRAFSRQPSPPISGGVQPDHHLILVEILLRKRSGLLGLVDHKIVVPPQRFHHCDDAIYWDFVSRLLALDSVFFQGHLEQLQHRALDGAQRIPKRFDVAIGIEEAVTALVREERLIRNRYPELYEILTRNIGMSPT